MLRQEVFLKEMDRIFKGLPGVHIIVEYILVAGSKVEEHADRLRATLVTARKSRVKFNPKKIQRCSTEVKFFGEMLTKDGLKPDPEKVATVEKMSFLKSRKELECQLGMLCKAMQRRSRAMQRRSRMDMVSRARGSVYRDQENDHRSFWSCAAVL